MGSEQITNRRKWAKYENHWYAPAEWTKYCHAHNISETLGDYQEITEVLYQARQAIVRSAASGANVAPMLSKYFDFEMRVRHYYAEHEHESVEDPSF